MNNKKNGNEPPKIRIGRLYIDPVFLVIFLFSILSVILLGLFMWYAS